MIYGYARVSTRGQAKDGNSLDAQTRALTDAGADIVYADAFTGTKANRPELNKLLEKIQDGDKLIVTKLDRVARSASQGCELIEDLLQRGVTVHILNMGIMDNTPNGKLIRNIMFAFAEFERDMIVERTQEGKAVAKAKAAAEGKPFREGRPKRMNRANRAQAVELLQTKSYKEVSELTGLSKSTLIRYKREVDKGAD